MRDIGLPPKQWMKMERMVVARRKLEGGKTPEEVSKDLGFRSISNFHRQFFNCYEMTATNFLRRRRVFNPEDELLVSTKSHKAKSSRKRKPGDLDLEGDPTC
jgi:AraC-like DNA-binding protein